MLWGMTILDRGIKRYVVDNSSALQAVVWNLMNGQYLLWFIFLFTFLTGKVTDWAESWGDVVGIHGLGNLTEDALSS